uniref:Uncharacterized protein n=1 Tax=Physcomitrium patens TaxID=3218 RepID=A0A2K1L9R8_PHYPA|nr:hypothetical protein PHYPA_001200 [Physcomitrium patens]
MCFDFKTHKFFISRDVYFNKVVVEILPTIHSISSKDDLLYTFLDLNSTTPLHEDTTIIPTSNLIHCINDFLNSLTL